MIVTVRTERSGTLPAVRSRTLLFTLLVFPLLAFAAGDVPAARSGRVHLALVEDVPFITTPDNVTAAMLDLAAVKPGDHVIDLGSGDGRIVIAAARRGATGLGVEIDPRLVQESIANAARAGVSARAKFLEQDLFRTDLSRASVVTMYLLPDVNLQLRPAILALRPGTRVVSHDWDMGDWQPDRSVALAVPDKAIGLSKSSRVHLWIVPARLEGLWCGVHAKRRAILRLWQSYQFVEGHIEDDRGMPGAISGRIEGTTVAMQRTGAPRSGRMRLAVGKDGLRSTQATGAYASFKGVEWRRAEGTSCVFG